MHEAEAGVAYRGANATRYVNYTTVTGIFAQDDPATDASNFDYATSNLGLLNRTYPSDALSSNASTTQWQRLYSYMNYLQAQTPSNVAYKLFFAGRHGEGAHNVAEAFYGTEAWDCYWSLRDGNETSTWADAKLTPTGIAQARVAHDFWARALRPEVGALAPQSYYVSPLARCLQTAETTFAGLQLPEDSPFSPTVKELLRETIGIHTCDRRSSRTWIAENYPAWEIEKGFAEEDPLWKADVRESSSAQVLRLKTLLDDIFAHDPNDVVSLTSHSGSIRALLAAVGHREFSLATGGVIPVLVRAETVEGAPPNRTVEPGTGPPTCGAGVVVPTGEA
ncbi:uncharacterized protein K452DRAFT_233920 [Aplosporella prunicola CBS 121167]|uniref:Phosphoglycerate mutase n=1 Tax=Aplosporella prunicola CBS 121167 TaxID=1176127 RepID=A0A6A6B424_9PEZI|nr:uncharacterized protein K452DRAFT_233920 [Aplosporella prunicola CBS 121167]KAF2138576.1 hypothetical protein K452DRAFT_233920 [Aplosporella prunicola CBS 121167]